MKIDWEACIIGGVICGIAMLCILVAFVLCGSDPQGPPIHTVCGKVTKVFSYTNSKKGITTDALFEIKNSYTEYRFTIIGSVGEGDEQCVSISEQDFQTQQLLHVKK